MHAPATAELDRRSFLIAAGTATAATTAALSSHAATARADEAGESAEADAAEAPVETPVPDEVLECDVAVVGCGVAGISACTQAAELGASVIGLDRALGVAGTNGVNTVGFYGVANPEEIPLHFQQLTEMSHYVMNNLFLRTYLGTVEDVIARYKEKGLTIQTSHVEYTEEAPGFYGVGSVIDTTLHVLANRGVDRAAEYEAMLATYDNIDIHWQTEVTQLIQDENGAVTGCFATDAEGRVYQINAKGGVIVCCGGFVHNAEMVDRYLGGATVYSFASSFNDGAGIKLAQSAGAQLGKNFSFNMSEGGGLNHKSAEFNTSLFGTRAISRSPIMGDVILNRRAERFVDEAVFTKKTAMFCGEALTRESSPFYTVMSQAEFDAVKEQTMFDYVLNRYGYAIEHDMILMFFAQAPLDTIEEDAQLAIEEGWCWKADTFEELEEASGLTGLAATMNHYNEMCAAGEDTDLYKDPAFLVAYAPEDGPFYLVEHDVSAWATQGGIKVDGNCRALTRDLSVIDGLYVAGMDAETNSMPYLYGGSAQGFALGGGAIAAKHAVSRAQA